MARIYLETSFISACVTTRTDPGSRDRRATSRRWWDHRASDHSLFISQEVLTELRHPKFPGGEAAVALVAGLPMLDINDRASRLAGVFVDEFVMPGPPDAGDALHVATACVHAIDFILSWNVHHLANLNKVLHLRRVCERFGVTAPTIVTPQFGAE